MSTDGNESRARTGRDETPYRSLAESAADGILMTDEGGVIRYANPSACRMFGFDPGGLQGLPLEDLVPERLRGAHRKGMERYGATGRRHLDWERIELSGLHREGHEFPVEVSLGDFTRRGSRYYVGFLRDLTHQRRVEQNLMRTRLALRRAELAKRRFYSEVIRAVTHDRLQLSDAIPLPTGDSPALSLDLGDPDSYSTLRDRLGEVARAAGLPEEDAADLVLASAEAASNAIKHAGGGVVTVYVLEDRVVVRVADRGKGIQSDVLPSSLLVPGFSTAVSLGMGYTMMLHLCDHVRLSTGPGGTVVELDRWIDPARREEEHWHEVMDRLGD